MDFNQPSLIVKNLDFGDEAKNKIMSGVRKLGDAVQSTLGASGKCVIFETAQGGVSITKDGVTVAESVVLLDPVENMGASLVKEAAQKTVKEVGDATSTATVLARYLLEYASNEKDATVREIKDGLNTGLEKVLAALEAYAIDVDDAMLNDVATISCNNDKELGSIIGEAFANVGKDGVVLIDDSETNETYADIIDGVQFDSKLKSPYFVTDKGRGVSEMEDPLILISSSEIGTLESIQKVVDYAIRNNRALLIVSEVSAQLYKVMLANKVKGNIKVNIVSPPGFGKTKADTLDDLAILTGAKVFNEELGDDENLIDVDILGTASKCVTDDKNTVITIDEKNDVISERINDVKGLIENEENPYLKKKLEQRLAMLSGKVGVIYVGADSNVELKEKKDRVDDAVHATKCALRGGIVAGGGVAFKDAVSVLDESDAGERVLSSAIFMPINVILNNAHKEWAEGMEKEGIGMNVITGEVVNMVDAKIIDPLLVTKTALINAVSVASTIISADCVISNIRQGDE